MPIEDAMLLIPLPSNLWVINSQEMQVVDFRGKTQDYLYNASL
jgi:hypothetical protein